MKIARHHIRSIVSGAGAGVVSTIVMTVPIAISARCGLIDRIPPEEVTARVAETALDDQQIPEPVISAVWPFTHLAYGALCGVLYRCVPRSLRPDRMGTGVVYGVGIWTANYFGYLPMLHLYPPPQRDAPARPIVMILAHMLFGAVLARLSPCPRRRR